MNHPFIVFSAIACLSPLAIAQNPFAFPDKKESRPIVPFPRAPMNVVPMPSAPEEGAAGKISIEFPQGLDPDSVPKFEDLKWVKDTRGKVIERAQQAYQEGPDALEKLATQLQTAELKDQDGRYTTCYFIVHITGSDAPESREFWGDYQKRLFAEWRKRYPNSKAAVLAEGRMYLQLARAARLNGTGVKDIERKWEHSLELYAKAKAIFNECRDLQSKDPAWAQNYLSALDDLGQDKAEFDKVMAQLIKDFPDCGFAMSRAVWGYRLQMQHEDAIWDQELRKHLSALPPEKAAKAYALTLGEIAALQGLRDSGLNPFTTRIDRELLIKGLDLLVREYPESPVIAATEASLAAHPLRDRYRIQSALKRAGTHFDLLQFSDESGYAPCRNTMLATPFDPKSVGLPEFKDWTFGYPPESAARIEKAIAEGPRAVEELIQHFRTKEVKDQNGNYNSIFFFRWFANEVTEISEYRDAAKKRKLLDAWRAEFPDSPFARLASACHWSAQAWDARSDNFAGQVSQSQWALFGKRLKLMREDLEASRELLTTEPAWADAAFTYCLGAGDAELFQEAATESFRAFPDCEDLMLGASNHFMSKWGGKPGSWEPWLREMLKDQPEDIRAMSYARGVASMISRAQAGSDALQDFLGNVQIDGPTLREGLRLLREQYPDSNKLANMEAIAAPYTRDHHLAYEAFQRMKGRMDLSVWRNPTIYEQTFSHVMSSKWLEQQIQPSPPK